MTRRERDPSDPGAFGPWPDGLGDPLTQDEVDALPEGTRVSVVWSGGNGPHTYRMLSGGLVDTIYQDHLGFVGPAKPYTVVRVFR